MNVKVEAKTEMGKGDKKEANNKGHKKGAVAPAPPADEDDEFIGDAESGEPDPAKPTEKIHRDRGKSVASARSRMSEGTSATSTSNTRNEVSSNLTSLADLELLYANRCAKAWMHSKISLRLFLMLLIPFIGLIILLVVGIQSSLDDTKAAKDIETLAEVAQQTLFVVHALGAEYTDCLWWSLDESLSSGINLTHGGVGGVGFTSILKTTDTNIVNFIHAIKTTPIAEISERLSDLIAITMNKLDTITNFRYSVIKFRVDKYDIIDFYNTLVDHMILIVDFISTMADAATIRAVQALISWSRTKTAIERERHTFGMILLTEFTDDLYTQWVEYVGVEDLWKERFLTIAPDDMREHAEVFFRSDLIRHMQDLRTASMSVFTPNDSKILPNITFDEWWVPVTEVVEEMKLYRRVITNEIVALARSRVQSSELLLTGYILLAILSSTLSVFIALLVGWSVAKPWTALTTLRTKMIETLKEKDALNAVVNKFVPHDFLELMAVKSLYDLQLGNCMLKRSTLLCTEIRNFSTLSERMAPHQNFQFLNAWLLETGPVVRRHGGFIDKFRGSGISAIFQDPNDAVDAGLELLEVAARHNSEETMSSLMIDVGVAVHTGDIMLGTIGEETRMETAIISEALQVALQACALTDMFRCQMLVTKETYMLLNVEGISVRFCGEIGVQNSHLRLQVFEMLQPNDHEKLESLNTFTQAMKAHQNLNFEEAGRLFDIVLTSNPNDVLALRRKHLAQNNEWLDILGESH